MIDGQPYTRIDVSTVIRTDGHSIVTTQAATRLNVHITGLREKTLRRLAHAAAGSAREPSAWKTTEINCGKAEGRMDGWI